MTDDPAALKAAGTALVAVIEAYSATVVTDLDLSVRWTCTHWHGSEIGVQLLF